MQDVTYLRRFAKEKATNVLTSVNWLIVEILLHVKGIRGEKTTIRTTRMVTGASQLSLAKELWAGCWMVKRGEGKCGKVCKLVMIPQIGKNSQNGSVNWARRLFFVTGKVPAITMLHKKFCEGTVQTCAAAICWVHAALHLRSTSFCVSALNLCKALTLQVLRYWYTGRLNTWFAKLGHELATARYCQPWRWRSR